MQNNNNEDIYVPKSGTRKLDRITNYRDPTVFMDKDEHLRPLFAEIQAHGASDVYIQDGKPIMVLVRGDMYAATHRIIEKSEAQWLLTHIAGKSALSAISAQKAINTTFALFDETTNERSLAGYKLANSYRVNAVGIMSQGVQSFQITMRAIPKDPYRYNEIGLKEKFVIRCLPAQGIVLVAGKTGSGKSTTLSSIMRYALEGDTPIKGNIITHEDPIEFTYDNIVSRHSIVVQSQIPDNFTDFGAANREAMRRKPAAIIVGELRDRETIMSAVEATLTGHPVFGTVHSSSVTEVVPRMVAQFPTEEKSNALFEIISNTVMIVAQRLIKKVDGKLMAVQEYLYLTEKIREELLVISDPIAMNIKIKELMKRGSFDENSPISPMFSVQGEKLFKEGLIDEKAYEYLKKVDE